MTEPMGRPGNFFPLNLFSPLLFCSLKVPKQWGGSHSTSLPLLVLLCLSQRPKTFLQNRKICRVFLCCRGGDLLDRKLRRRKSACGARKPSLWTRFSRKNRVPTTSPSKDIQLLRRIFTRNFSKIPAFRPVNFLPLGRFPPNSPPT